VLGLLGLVVLLSKVTFMVRVSALLAIAGNNNNNDDMHLL